MRLKYILPAIILPLLAGCSKIEEFRRPSTSGEPTQTLPILYVDTEGGKGINEKTSWKNATVSLMDPEGAWDMEATDVKVKGRGNSSWTFPKKPFNVKFGSPVGVMDMTQASRWCMLANWRDATLIRNAVALEIARKTSLDWTPEGRFVEVVVDGELQGNYYMTEKVEIGPGRVDVGADGFLICIDNYYEGTFRFRTRRNSLPVVIQPSDDNSLDEDSFEEVRNYLDSVEDALYKGKGDWRSLIDARSFCDWLIVHELTGNDEPTRPHSVYMHKSSGGLLAAGPCWDYDCRTFTPGTTGILNRNAVWFDALLSQSDFCDMLKERWTTLKPAFSEEIPPYIDKIYSSIEVSASLNHDMWPINLPFINQNGDEKLSFQQAVERLKEAYLERLVTLDEAISAL